MASESSPGVVGAFSSETFALASLAAPTQTSPSNSSTIAPGANYDRPTFTWSAVPGAASYSLYLVDNTANKVVLNSFNVGNVTSYPLDRCAAR